MAEDEARTDSDVLALLLTDEAPWSVDEVVREHGNRVAAHDALARLHGSGLIHRLNEFVFPTRAAKHSARLAL